MTPFHYLSRREVTFNHLTLQTESPGEEETGSENERQQQPDTHDVQETTEAVWSRSQLLQQSTTCLSDRQEQQETGERLGVCMHSRVPGDCLFNWRATCVPKRTCHFTCCCRSDVQGILWSCLTGACLQMTGPFDERALPEPLTQ